MEPVFTSDELQRLEEAHPDGLPAGAVVELLRQRGVELAEATLRKYVQLGLLPRSHRVGRKGKHRGSVGLYPAGIVGRIAEIRRLMGTGLTLEDIQRSAASFGPQLDTLRLAADALVTRLEEEITARGELRGLPIARVRALRQQAEQLVAALSEATQAVLPPELSGTGVAEQDPAEIARQAVRTLAGARRTAPPPASSPAAGANATTSAAARSTPRKSLVQRSGNSR